MGASSILRTCAAHAADAVQLQAHLPNVANARHSVADPAACWDELPCTCAAVSGLPAAVHTSARQALVRTAHVRHEVAGQSKLVPWPRQPSCCQAFPAGAFLPAKLLHANAPHCCRLGGSLHCCQTCCPDGVEPQFACTACGLLSIRKRWCHLSSSQEL